MKFVSLCLALAVSALAADTPPQLSRLAIIEVPSASSAEFYAVQRETAEIYKANKAPIPRMAWTSMSGEQRFFTLVPLEGLAKLSDPTWLSQQGEERSRQARQSRLAQANAATTIKLITDQKDVTWDPTPQGGPDPYAMVTTYNVKPSKVLDFLALLKESNEVTKKIGKAKSIYTSRVTFGGDTYDFYVVTGYASLADITPGSTFRTTMGEAAYTAYNQKMGQVINSVHRDIIRFRPEYSYVPAN